MADLNNAAAKGKEVAENLKNEAKDGAENAKDFAQNLKDRVVETGSVIKDKMTDFTREAIHKGQDAHEHFVEIIKGNPYKSLGVAFVGGWLISKCLGRSNNK